VTISSSGPETGSWCRTTSRGGTFTFPITALRTMTAPDHQPAGDRRSGDRRGGEGSVVIADAIAIRSMAYFTLSFDHRIGRWSPGGMFLAEIAECWRSLIRSESIMGRNEDGNV